MKQKRKLGRKLLSFLLTLAMLVGLMPGMGMTALAWDGDPYASLLNTTTVVTFDNKEWYLIENNSTAVDAGTATLLTKECVAASTYDSSGSYVQYPSSTVKTAVDNWYNSNITDDAKGAVSSGGMFLLTIGQANAMTADTRKCSQASGAWDNCWWLCSPGNNPIVAACVKGDDGLVNDEGYMADSTLGVRPALNLDLSKVVFDSTTKTFSPSVSYPLWVGGTQVTSANATDTTTHPTWSYAADTNTLTLSGYTFSGEGKGVEYTGDGELKIVITGQNSITSTTDYQGCIVGINSDLNLSGTGSLTLTSANGYGGIYNLKNITIESGTVTATGKICGIRAASGDVTIKDGKVTAKGIGGIMAGGDGSVKISGGTITASGSGQAIYGTVKNAIAGTGWTDTDGTQGKAAIPVSTDGQSLESYKKVQFPSVKAAQTITASDVTATYGDTGKKVEATTDGNGAISYTVKSGDAVTVDASGNLTIVKAGSAVITVTAAETDTYDKATKDVNVTVNSKAMTISAEDVNVTVDGQPHGITVNVTDPATGYTVKYRTEAGSYTLDASPTQTEVGEKTVYYQVTAANYTTYTGSAKVTVNAKQTQTITASDVTATYGDTNKSVSASVTDPAQGGGAISYAVKDGSADYIDVNATTGALTIKKVPADGKAYVVVTAAETAAYAQATKDVTINISKANAVPATVTANNRTYDGTEKPLVNVTGEATGGTMNYAIGSDETTAPTEGWGTSIPKGTDAKTYYVWYKAVGDADHNDSEPKCVTVTISVPEVVATPAFSPEAGTYTEVQSVTITCATEGATIHYTTDGSEPTSSSTTYNSAISVGESTTIKAIAVKKGMTDSEVASAEYTINIPKEKVATPIFSPEAGTYTEEQSVTISCSTDGATIHYTTDGSEPTSSSTTYSSAISVGETTTIKAIAVKKGMTDSEVASAEYTINIPKEKVATPAFSPEAGTYTEVQSVTITCATEGATIHYTTDGTLPVVGSSIYTSPITVHETTTIKAIGVKEGMTDSSVASATYTISEKPEPGTVATPTFSPEGGTYSDPQMVSINSETSGATIYYTTDGNDPTTESATFSSEITVTETTTIKAIAVKEGMTDSSVASVTYTISEEPEPGPEPEPSEDTKVDVGGLSDGDITDDLRGKGYDSVESIESALQTALSIETEEKKENSELVDAKLMISTDGGETWQEATLENFPEGGIDAILPYPDGTNGNEYSFSVAHMIGAGPRAGEIETPGTTNTASGISAHFNGLSPVMITWTKNSSPSKDDSKSEEKAHTHHYVWETVEATEESDGEFRYVCDICGAVQTRVPITAYYVFNKNTTEKIRKAGQGATVKIETYRWISFHKMVMEALAERPDVTLEISFLDEEYKGNRVTVTIPAGTDAMSLVDDNGFVGFLYLAVKYGYTLVD